MKRTLQVILSASALSVMTFSALAQDPPNPKADRPQDARDRMPPARHAERLQDAAKASDLIGMTVKNYQDEKLGKVEDLAVDMESGRVIQVILSIGGFIGIGDTLTAVPPGALHRDVANKVLHLDADKEKLKSAPKFENAKWAEGSDSNHLSVVYGYYGEESAFRFIHRGDALPDAKGNPETVPNTDGIRNPNAIPDQNRSARERQWMIPESRLGHAQKASKVIGTTVNNLQDEKVGKVENILVDLPSGRLVTVIVSSGGFLGLGDELSAVPPTALRYNTERDTLQLDVSKETLTKTPHFKANEWPDFNQPMYADGVYRAYRVEPYFSTNATTEPDNTVRNVRDRNDRTLTPFDQGKSKADRDTTAQIRKEINSGKDMSVNAKNVKIITNQGRVTLRGPVNSEQEKQIIGEIAARIATLANVDNQLEVKRSTSND